MPNSTDVLAEARSLLQGRLDQIETERKRLERAIAELNGDAPKPGRPRAKAKPKAKAAATEPKQRRRRNGKTRGDEAVNLIAKHPGISASDIAKTMKIKPNYLYRVLGDLEKEGRVKKDGRSYFPVAFE